VKFQKDPIFIADSLTVGCCRNCPGVHINLLDRGDAVVATAILPLESIEILCRELKAEGRRRAREMGLH
jgi:hypothetical protein